MAYHRRVLPSVGRGLHDEVQVVSALPPAAGVGEEHLLPILRHRQVVDERQLPAGDHLTPGDQPSSFTCDHRAERLRLRPLSCLSQPLTWTHL